jgi:hypothetical protein
MPAELSISEHVLAKPTRTAVDVLSACRPYGLVALFDTLAIVLPAYFMRKATCVNAGSWSPHHWELQA